MVAIAFLAFMIFTSNPFLRLDPVPEEGRDLTPTEATEHAARTAEARDAEDAIEQRLADEVAELRAALAGAPAVQAAPEAASRVSPDTRAGPDSDVLAFAAMARQQRWLVWA